MKRLILAIILIAGGYVAIEHTERFYYAAKYLPGIGPILTAIEHVRRLKFEAEEKMVKEVEEYIELKKLDR